MPEKYSKFTSRWAIVMVSIMAILELLNILFVGKELNLLVAIPEVFFVLFVLYGIGNVRYAFLLHIIFCTTGFDATSALTEFELFSYTKVKLFGPLTVSYIILGMIWIKTSKIKISPDLRTTILFNFYNILKLFLFYGTLVGIVGLAVFSYRLTDFIPPFLYLLVGYLYLDIYLRLYNRSYLKKCYFVALCLIIASPVASFISYFILNVRSAYAGYDAIIYNEAFLLAPVLIMIFFYKEELKGLSMISLCLYLMLILAAGRGGQFLAILVCLIMIAYLVYFSPEHKHGILANMVKIALPLSIIGIVIYFSTLDAAESLATIKFNELLSMLGAFSDIGSNKMDLTSIAESPYTRIAEVFNIIDNGFQNPLGLIFGKGYGGTFTDSTGMFALVDVSNGGYPMEVVQSGKYGAPHSFLPNILLFNGLVGLYMIVKLAIKYFRQIKYTPLIFATYTLFFYSFYFNTNLFITTSFALFAAEYKIQFRLNDRIKKQG